MSEEPGSWQAPLERGALARYLRRQMAGHLVDDSGVAESGFAIYTLSDPRDLRTVRYVGQTRSPGRRWLQHVQTAQLWLPADVPWWFDSPKLRPLYDWIRELHREDYRLPVMMVTLWVPSAQAARLAERELILQHLTRQQTLLNVESEQLDRQLGLL